MVKTKPNGLDNPRTITVIKYMSAANTWLYRRTGGRVGGTWRVGAAFRKPAPVCLLTTTGRKSGEPRTVPLVYLEQGRSIVLVASQGGTPTNPQWFHNLVADPAVTAQFGRRRQQMLARVVDADERARLWPLLVDMYADYDSYQSWTQRTIPVVVCDPA